MRSARVSLLLTVALVAVLPGCAYLNRANQSASGVQATGISILPSLSSDARWVAFESQGAALVPGDTNFAIDVFARDNLTKQVVRVSVATDGTEANGRSDWPSISNDASRIVFTSEATNLDPGDTDPDRDVYMHDRDTDHDGIFDEPGAVSTTLLSGDVPAGSWCDVPEIFGNGGGAVYQVEQPNSTNVYSTTMFAGVFPVTRLVSAPLAGGSADGPSYEASVDVDGGVIAFTTRATNLFAGDTNGVADVAVWDVRGVPFGLPVFLGRLAAAVVARRRQWRAFGERRRQRRRVLVRSDQPRAGRDRDLARRVRRRPANQHDHRREPQGGRCECERRRQPRPVDQRRRQPCQLHLDRDRPRPRQHVVRRRLRARPRVGPDPAREHDLHARAGKSVQRPVNDERRRQVRRVRQHRHQLRDARRERQLAGCLHARRDRAPHRRRDPDGKPSNVGAYVAPPRIKWGANTLHVAGKGFSHDVSVGLGDGVTVLDVQATPTELVVQVDVANGSTGTRNLVVNNNGVYEPSSHASTQVCVGVRVDPALGDRARSDLGSRRSRTSSSCCRTTSSPTRRARRRISPALSTRASSSTSTRTSLRSTPTSRCSRP